MDHILDLDRQEDQLHEIYKDLRQSNTILFLGAGASVGEKRYLSKEIIELYEQYLGKQLDENNITEFVDILSADPNFSRSHFDSFVIELLKKLKVTEAHKILATIPWREIITTNYDLLVEQAYDAISSSSQKIYDLKTVKKLSQLNYKESNTEVKYVKLNGCMQDIGMYPLAFSTDDFNRLKSFYKNVLNELKNLSPEISFISIGYSYSDMFGKELLQKFDSYNYRDKRWMINIDPYPNENALSFYTKNKICIVKASFEEFFLRYQAWELKQLDSIIKKKGLSISDSKNQNISLPPKLLLNLEGIVRQLNVLNSTRERFIKDSEFYKGEEPNFNIVARNVDVVKLKYIKKFKEEIKRVFEQNHSTLVPIFFISGEFGIGKSTIALRLIHELENEEEMGLVAFELLDFNRIKKESIIELVNGCKSKHLVFYCDEVEIESYFKTLLDLQRDLSIEQFQGCNVFFLAPIRENILEKFKLQRTLQRAYYLELKGEFEESEISELLEKLKNTDLVSFRDANEKQLIINRIKKEYNSDSFISLMSTITSGRHENDLIDSYNQLSKDAQVAFLYTALLHKHKLWMPASWLKQNISMSWEDFTTKIIRAEGKGILIQEIKQSRGTQPDLYFRTKHPIIASKLVEKFVPSKDKQYALYDRMLKTIEPGQVSSYLANNLLKAFIKNNEYNDLQLNKLFDSAHTKLSDDPHFLLNYAINLEKRRTVDSLKKALELLIYAESLLEYRNHRFIHRRGVISFELARLYFEKGKSSYVTFYLNEAKELFITKQLLDPFSAFSYVDYIKLLIWELDNSSHEEGDNVQMQIEIEELFDLANKTVIDGIDRVNSLYSRYSEYLENMPGFVDYELYLEGLYNKLELRPYACILLFNYYYKNNNEDACDRIIEEIEHYQENFEVIKFLLKYYGRALYNPNNRIKLLRISRQNPNLEKESPLRFNYFNFIAETYNNNFKDGRDYLSSIQTRFQNLNPEFHYIWSDSDGTESRFEAKIIKRSNEKFKAIKIPSLQQSIRLIKGNYDAFSIGSDVIVRIHFYLYGLMAEIIEDVDKINME